MSTAVGVDVGGSTLRAALVDETGAIVKSARQLVDEREPEVLLAQLEGVLAELGEDAARGPVGMGLAAQLWLETGTVAVAPNLGWHDVPFRSLAEAKLGRRVRLVNDLNAIAVGEARAGAGRGASDVVCVFVGTGVGMGAVVGGRLVEGADGLATELGHTKVASPHDGRLCGCGERGCLEAYTSGHHLPELIAAKVAAGVPSQLVDEAQADLSAIDAEGIEAAAVAGDAAARQLWQEVAEYLGRGIGNVVTLFNPRVVVLGGGVLMSAPSLRQAVQTQIGDFAARAHQRHLAIRVSELADEAGIIGAGLLAGQLSS